jgi:TnpA family transposase
VFYKQVSGRYSPFYTRVIAVTVSEAPYVFDGLMHHVHQTDLRFREHYTDTAGATDHVFGLCCRPGFQFAPRIRDLKVRNLYTIEKPGTYPLLEPLIGEAIDPAAIIGQWPELKCCVFSLSFLTLKKPPCRCVWTRKGSHEFRSEACPFCSLQNRDQNV